MIAAAFRPFAITAVIKAKLKLNLMLTGDLTDSIGELPSVASSDHIYTLWNKKINNMEMGRLFHINKR